jgi:hypothetical protein
VGLTALFHFGPYIALALALVGCWGLWQEHKADSLKHANDQAVIQQNLKDHANSEKQLGILQGKLEGINAKTQPTIQYITTAPVTAGCGPTVGYAVDRVRDDRGGSKVPAGPQPAKPGAVPVPLHTVANPQTK